MNTLLIIKPHSFVDLITNSSSELFLCDIRKSLSAFKDILIALAAQQDTPIPASDLFTSVFQEPTVCMYNFDPRQFPRFAWYHSIMDYTSGDKHPVQVACREAQEAFEKANPRPKIQKSMEAWWAKSREIDKPWDDLKSEAKLAMLQWAFQSNNLPWTYQKPTGSHPVWYREGNDKFWEIAEQFEEAVNWDFKLKKGMIMIHSTSDNTVPYEFMEAIEATIPCTRRHLG